MSEPNAATPQGRGQCPPDCGHTEQEHEAFDAGVMAGEAGQDECPYAEAQLREAWFTGHSVGTLNQAAPEAGENLFMLLAQIAERDGATPLHKHDGCWVRKIDDHWTVAVNGHREVQKFGTVSVQPFHCYVEFNGWPAGLFNPFSGWIAAGEVANEDAFCEALKQAASRHN